MQAPHFRKQKVAPDVNYETPDWLYQIFHREFEFTHDLAAIKENAKAPFFPDSLAVEWHTLDGWLWLNPPFAGIRQWVERAYVESRKGAKIVVLTPSTVLGGPYMKTHPPEEIRFVSSVPVFKNTFTGKTIRFAPAIMIFDKGRKRGTFSFIQKPK